MIYDCILYAGERDALEIRLRELAEVVDKFVIVEASDALRGHRVECGSARNVAWFVLGTAVSARVTHILVDELLPLDPTTAKDYLRNQVLRGLTRADPDDLVICSDVDEIPRTQLIRHWNEGRFGVFDRDKIIRFAMTEYYYALDWRIPIEVRWNLSFMTSMWRIAKSTPARLRTVGITYPDAGWHFACLGDAKPVGALQVKVVEIDSTYPQYVRDNLDRFAHLRKGP